LEASKTFFGRHGCFQQAQPKIAKKSRIQFAEAGMRTTNLASGSEKPFLITIQNFKTEQSWIASPGRLYYAELPVTGDSQPVAPGKEIEDLPFLGILSNKPCQGMEGQKLDEREVKGTRLTVWKCRHAESGETYLQHYSTLLGVVVRQESGEGQILELRDINLDPPGAAAFKPSELWREVTLEEFFTGVPALPEYEEEK